VCRLTFSGVMCSFLLSQNPDVEAKVLAELDSLELLVTPERPNPRKLEWADLNKLVYLQAVIKVHNPISSPGVKPGIT
jgi:hypothetical protein